MYRPLLGGIAKKPITLNIRNLQVCLLSLLLLKIHLEEEEVVLKMMKTHNLLKS